MTISLDYSGDHAFVDGIETITLTPQNPAATAVTGVKARRSSKTKAAISPGVSFSSEPVSETWFIWSGPLSSTVPKPGDKLTDVNTVVWIIQTVQTRDDGAQYSCFATQAAS